MSAGLFMDDHVVSCVERGDAEGIALASLGLRRGGPDHALRPITPRLRGALGRDCAVARMTGEVMRHLGAPNPLSSFFVANRTRRGVGMPFVGFWLGTGTAVHLPYFDHAVADLLLGLPMATLADHRFHAEAMEWAYPAYRSLPFRPKVVKGEHNRGQYARYAASVLRFVGWGRRMGWGGRWTLGPRLWRCLLDLNYSGDIRWFGSLAVYLAEMEQLTANRGPEVP